MQQNQRYCLFYSGHFPSWHLRYIFVRFRTQLTLHTVPSADAKGFMLLLSHVVVLPNICKQAFMCSTGGFSLFISQILDQSTFE